MKTTNTTPPAPNTRPLRVKTHVKAGAVGTSPGVIGPFEGGGK